MEEYTLCLQNVVWNFCNNFIGLTDF